MKIKYNAFGKGRHSVRFNSEPDFTIAINIFFGLAAIIGVLFILLGTGLI